MTSLFRTLQKCLYSISHKYVHVGIPFQREINGRVQVEYIYTVHVRSTPDNSNLALKIHFPLHFLHTFVAVFLLKQLCILSLASLLFFGPKGLQVSLYFLYFLYFRTFPIFPYLVCKCPIIPIIPSENKNIQKFMNFCWWNMTKTVNFSDHPRPKLVIVILLVHVNVLYFTLLSVVIFIQILSRFQKEYAPTLCALIFQTEED